VHLHSLGVSSRQQCRPFFFFFSVSTIGSRLNHRLGTGFIHGILYNSILMHNKHTGEMDGGADGLAGRADDDGFFPQTQIRLMEGDG
jgi:hypothetical protein